MVHFQKHVHRTLKPIMKINNNNGFRKVPTSSFIIRKKFKNLPDMPGACRMKMSLMEAEKFQPSREDGDVSLHDESGKHL